MTTPPDFQAVPSDALPHLIIAKAELAQVLGFNVQQLNTMMRAQMPHAVVAVDSQSRDLYAPAHNATVTGRAAAPLQEREEIFFVRDDPDAMADNFWLQLHIKGVHQNGAPLAVMGVMCAPVDDQRIKLSHPWLTPVVESDNASLSTCFFYRATMGHDRIAAFEDLVCRVIGHTLKPDYKPPVSPPYQSL